jgi:hypothetical protein
LPPDCHLIATWLLLQADEGTTCIFSIVGCTDSEATDFASDANTEDGSCLYAIHGTSRRLPLDDHLMTT